MKSRFASQLGGGKPANLAYDTWKSAARKARKEAVEEFIRKGRKKVTKKVPILGLLFLVEEIEAKGIVGGVTNNLLDQVPWLGWVKLAHECAYGDWLPDR